MQRVNRIQKGIIGILLCAILLTEPFSGIMKFLDIHAHGANYAYDTVYYSDIKKNNNDLFKDLGLSVVKTSPMYIKKEYKDSKWKNVGTEASTGKDGRNLYDDDMGSELRLMQDGWFYESEEVDGKKRPIKLYCDGKERVLDVYYDLLESTDFKNIAISHSTTEGLTTGWYEIYASENKDTLYSPENRVIEYKTGATRMQIYKFKEKITARYVGCRIINCIASSDLDTVRNGKYTQDAGNIYMRLREFNIYSGDESPYYKYQSNPNIEDLRKEGKLDAEGTYELSYPKSLIANKLPTANGKFAMINGVRKTIKCNTLSTGEVADFHRITDGRGGWNYDIKETNNTTSMYFLDKNRVLKDDPKKLYYQFNYEFDDIANVTGIMYYTTTYFEYQAFHYIFSVAEKESDLFTDASYTSPGIYSASTCAEITLNVNPKPRGKYIGFRIICGVQPIITGLSESSYPWQRTYLRVGELMAFGTYDKSKQDVASMNVIHPQTGSSYVQSGSASATYNKNCDSNGKYPDGTVATLNAPVTIRNERDDKLYYFSYWSSDTQGKNKLSEDFDYKVTLKDSEQMIYANYEWKSSRPPVTYTFTDRNGNKIYEAVVPLGSYVSPYVAQEASKKVPYVAGYVGKTEQKRIGSLICDMQVWNNDLYGTPALANTTFKAQYEYAPTEYDVDVNGEKSKSKFDKKINANDDNAQSWTVNGVPFATGKTFSAYVTGDMDIVSSNDVTDASVSLYNPDNKKSASVGDNSLTFFGKLLIPNLAKLSETGLIIRSGDYLKDVDYTAKTYEKLMLSATDTANSIKATVKKPAGAYFSVTLKGVPRKGVRVARPYVIYTDSAGKTKTAYGNVVVLCNE